MSKAKEFAAFIKAATETAVRNFGPNVKLIISIRQDGQSALGQKIKQGNVDDLSDQTAFIADSFVKAMYALLREYDLPHDKAVQEVVEVLEITRNHAAKILDNYNG